MVQQSERSAIAKRALLDAAHRLFASQGYGQVSIDQIASEAGYAKGALYHHFGSKQDMFETVLDAVQSNLASQVAKSTNKPPSATASPPQLFAHGIYAYLIATNQHDIRQILLVDGPIVLGWQRWREIDDKYFLQTVRDRMRALMGQSANEGLLQSATRLLLGTITEAALSCATSKAPLKTALQHRLTFELMLKGLQGPYR